jgi:hypothetical protein
MKDLLDVLWYFLENKKYNYWYLWILIALLLILWWASFYLAITKENLNELIVNIWTYSFLWLLIFLLLLILWLGVKEKNDEEKRYWKDLIEDYFKNKWENKIISYKEMYKDELLMENIDWKDDEAKKKKLRRICRDLEDKWFLNKVLDSNNDVAYSFVGEKVNDKK